MARIGHSRLKAGWLRQRYDRWGWTVDRIAEAAGVDRTAIYDAIALHDIPLRGHTDRRPPITDGRHDEDIRQMRDRGLSWANIAAALDVSREAVQDRGAVLGLRTTLTESEASVVAASYSSGATIDEIAQQMGWSPRTARRKLLEVDVEIRGPGRRRSDRPR